MAGSAVTKDDLKSEAIYDILKGILDLAGYDRVYTECGADFPCGANGDSCEHFHKCKRDYNRYIKTKKLRRMIDQLKHGGSPMKLSDESYQKIDDAYTRASGEWIDLDWEEDMEVAGGVYVDLETIDPYDLDPELVKDLVMKVVNGTDMSLEDAAFEVTLFFSRARKFIDQVCQDARSAQAWADIAMGEIDAGDFDAALEAAKSAYDLEDNYGDARVWGEFYRVVKEELKKLQE